MVINNYFNNKTKIKNYVNTLDCCDEKKLRLCVGNVIITLT